MTSVEGGRIGLALGYDPAATVRQMASAAADAERAGFDMGFFSETLFTNRDSVSTLAAYSLATERMLLGATQVVRLRSPLVMAQTLATLDELNGGRTVLVIGAYTAKHAARNGVPPDDPVAVLREYLEVIRRLLAGQTVTYEGTGLTLSDVSLNFAPVRERIPIWIAANSKLGLRNAAEVGDGLLLDAGTSPAYSANAIAVVRAACDAAGRDFDGFEIAQLLNTSVEDDEPTALESIRWEIASKFRYPQTIRSKLLIGEPAIDSQDLPRLRAAYDEGGAQALAAALPPSYLRSMTCSGNPDQVRARVEQYREAGVRLPLVRPARAAQLPRLLDMFRS